MYVQQSSTLGSVGGFLRVFETSPISKLIYLARNRPKTQNQILKNLILNPPKTPRFIYQKPLYEPNRTLTKITQTVCVFDHSILINQT